MDNTDETGVFLTLNDCVTLYPRLKATESFLSDEERKIFLEIEKALYESFSIQELEELLEKSSVKPGAPGRV